MLEALFLIPAYNKLFLGISYMSMRSDYSVKMRNIKSYTTFFLISKAILNTLPELCALAQYKEENVESNTALHFVDWYGNIDLIRGFAFIPALIISLIWLLKGLLWAGGIIKQSGFIDHLKKKYEEEVLPKSELFLKKSINIAFLVFCIGAILLADFFIDIPSGAMNESYTINIIPDMLAVIFILWGVFKLQKYVPNTKKKTFLIGAIYAIVSTAREILATRYFLRYTLTDLRLDSAAENEYLVLQAVSVLEGITLIAFIYVLLCVLREIIRNHTGYAPISDDAAHNKAVIDKIEYVHAELFQKLKVAFVFGIIMALFNASYYFILPHAGFAWLINFIVSGVFAAMFIPCLFAISEEINYKYLLY
jgi:hypothetical protein